MVDEFEDDDFDAQFEDDDENFEVEPEDDFEEESESVEEEESFEDNGSQQQEEETGEEDEDFDKPVSEGDIVEVEIDDLGSKGDGIARVEGFVVFVPGGEVGETYDVEVTSVGNKFAFAEIAE